MLEDPHGLSGGSVCPEPHNCVVKNIKVAVFGKTGVGKTATIAKLCGKDVTSAHTKTSGINISTLYWHVKPHAPSEKQIFLHINFWDCGEESLQHYDYLQPAMLKDVGVYMFCFAMDKRSNWDGLKDLIDGITSKTSGTKTSLSIAVGTKLDSPFRDVTRTELSKFEASTNIPVFAVANSSVKGTEEFMDKFVCLLQERNFL
jgi:GTPase SAR1 family protein